MRLDQAQRLHKRGLDQRLRPFVRADEAQPAHHAPGHRRARLSDGERTLRAHHLLGDALGRRPGVGLKAPAVMEHPFVAPLVAILLEERGDEGERRIVGNYRRLGARGLEALEDRCGILDAFALWRYDQRDERQPGVFLKLRLDRGRPRNPFMADTLVAKEGPHLHRIRRQFRAEDPVGHGVLRSSACASARRRS